MRIFLWLKQLHTVQEFNVLRDSDVFSKLLDVFFSSGAGRRDQQRRNATGTKEEEGPG